MLSRAIDDLEPVLTRHGYDATAIAAQLHARSAEIRDFPTGTLAADRTAAQALTTIHSQGRRSTGKEREQNAQMASATR